MEKNSKNVSLKSGMSTFSPLVQYSAWNILAGAIRKDEEDAKMEAFKKSKYPSF